MNSEFKKGVFGYSPVIIQRRQVLGNVLKLLSSIKLKEN